MTEGNFHIVTMPRSGSKVLQSLLTLGIKFKYGDVCTIAPNHESYSLGEFLMFQHLRQWAYTKGDTAFRTRRMWNLYREVPDELVSLYDLKHVYPGRYQLVEADYSYFEGVPESAFSRRVNELIDSTVPWVSKSFPAEMTRSMRLDETFVYEQLKSLRPLSTTIALIRRNVVNACISAFFMRELNASTPFRMREKLKDRPSDAVSYQIGRPHLNHYCRLVKSYLGWIGKLGYDKLLFMEDVVAEPADTICNLLELSGQSDTIGLRAGLQRITGSGREASAHFDYREVVGNYAEVVESLRPVQELIDQLRH